MRRFLIDGLIVAVIMILSSAAYRIAALKKEIIDLEAKIQDSADKYNVAPGGYMGGMMLGPGMMG